MKRAAAVLFPYAVFGLLLAASWNRWIEPYIDSGRELMVPWRVAHGESLYGQIHFHHGPLAPFLGAAIDRVAGRSLPARVGFALLIALLHLEALRRIAGRFLGQWRASLVTSLGVAAAMFVRPGGWPFPFSFDTAIAVACLTGSVALESRADRRADVWIGACLAAALLSRLEIGLAGVAAIVWQERREPRRWILSAAAPLSLAALGYLSLSWGLSYQRLTRDGWLALAKPPVAFQNVYRSYAGLDRPLFRLTELALALILVAVAAALLAAGAAIADRMRSPRSSAAVEILAVAVLAGAAALCFSPPRTLIPTLELFPPLVRVVPPAVIAAAAVALYRRWRGLSLAHEPSDATLVVGAVFAGRLLLAAGYVGPYDAFFLPLPLVLGAGLALRAADASSGQLGKRLPRLAAAALAVFLIFRAASQCEGYRRSGWVSIETPAGSLSLAEPVASTTRLALADLSRRVPAGGTMVGFPEGGFFNYVLGRRNPTDREQFFPGHVETAAEEDRIIGRLTQSPPDAVFLCNVTAVGEHQPAFGSDYLVRLDSFLRRDFVAAASYGPGAGADAHVGDPQFFVTIRVPRRGAAESPR